MVTSLGGNCHHLSLLLTSGPKSSPVKRVNLEFPWDCWGAHLTGTSKASRDGFALDGFIMAGTTKQDDCTLRYRCLCQQRAAGTLGQHRPLLACHGEMAVGGPRPRLVLSPLFSLQLRAAGAAMGRHMSSSKAVEPRMPHPGSVGILVVPVGDPPPAASCRIPPVIHKSSPGFQARLCFALPPGVPFNLFLSREQFPG